MDITYTKEDYITTTAPYEEVEQSANPFEKEQKIAQLTNHAKSVGVRNFQTLYRQYVKTMRMMGGREYIENASNFEGQELELNTGDWTADDYGITRPGRGENPPETACPHPIMPVLRLTNIDTGIEKVKLAFKRGGIWRYLVCDRKQVASQNSIVGLADYGVAVTSENARYLVKYLHDVENLNYERIPEKKSVSRLGWIDGAGFSPYVEGLVFDGEESFKPFFNSVGEKGAMDKWVREVEKIRQGPNLAPRIVLAASFASALVKPCGGLPFFVHLWGGTEVGKTVGLMLAASVWADPEMGKYIHTFNTTAVAQELSAGFVNSLPLIVDELQIIKDKKDFDQTIYQIAEGVGKSRGQKTGGLQKVGTWKNCIITSGEQPISTASSGGGAVNRIIEVQCVDRLFSNPSELCSVISSNYGHAGRRFIELLSDPEVMEDAKQIQRDYYKMLNKQSTEKQALAASIVLTADLLIDTYIFKDGRQISFEEMWQFLSDKDAVSQEKRAYEWIWDWVVQNKANFFSEGNVHVMNCFGRIEKDAVSIIRSVFNDACMDRGYNPGSFAVWLRDNGLSRTDSDRKRTDKKVVIDGERCRCIVLLRGEDVPEGFEPVEEQIEF